MTAELRAQPRFPEGINVAADVELDSPFAEAGLEERDIIEQIDRRAVPTPQDAAARLEAAHRTGAVTVLLFVYRGKTQLYIAVNLRGEPHAG